MCRSPPSPHLLCDIPDCSRYRFSSFKSSKAMPRPLSGQSSRIVLPCAVAVSPIHGRIVGGKTRDQLGQLLVENQTAPEASPREKRSSVAARRPSAAMLSKWNRGQRSL